MNANETLIKVEGLQKYYKGGEKIIPNRFMQMYLKGHLQQCYSLENKNFTLFAFRRAYPFK